MDPNFFVASRRRRSELPGQKVSVNDRFKSYYSNMLGPFLLEGMEFKVVSCQQQKPCLKLYVDKVQLLYMYG